MGDARRSTHFAVDSQDEVFGLVEQRLSAEWGQASGSARFQPPTARAPVLDIDNRQTLVRDNVSAWKKRSATKSKSHVAVSNGFLAHPSNTHPTSQVRDAAICTPCHQRGARPRRRAPARALQN